MQMVEEGLQQAAQGNPPELGGGGQQAAPGVPGAPGAQLPPTADQIPGTIPQVQPGGIPGLEGEAANPAAGGQNALAGVTRETQTSRDRQGNEVA